MQTPIADPVAESMSNPKPSSSFPGDVPDSRVARRKVRAIAEWVALAVVLGLFVFRSDLRGGLTAALALSYLAVAWFFLARTKTLSWQALTGLFAVCLPWALVIGFVARAFAGSAGSRGFGPSTALAALAEESLSLLPLFVLVLLAPARVRRFAVCDWLLVGFFTGLALQAVEEFTQNGYGHYSLSPLSGGSSVGAVAGFAGRPILTALITVGIGLGASVWRHGGRPHFRPPVTYAWRALAVLVPVVVGWLVISAHAGYNATRVLGDDRWATVDGSLTALPLRLGWRLGNHGFGFGWFLLALLVLALMIDAGRLRNAADEADDPLPHPFAPTAAADSWAGRLTRWAGTSSAPPIALLVWVIAAGSAVIAYAVRDLVVVLLAFSMDPKQVAPRAEEPAEQSAAQSEAHVKARPGARPGARPRARAARRESRWSAISRGRAAGVMVRAIRAEAMALAAGPDSRAKRRTVRGFGLVGLAGVLVAAFWVGPHWAARAGDQLAPGVSAAAGVGGASEHTVWLGGALERLGPWWSSLSLFGLVLVVLGFAATVVLSAGPLDLPLGAIVSNSFLADRFTRAPEFGRDPATWLQGYFSASTPAEVFVDGAGAALGVLPPVVGGPPAANHVRIAIREFLDDPTRFTAARRAAAKKAAQYPSASDETAPIRIRSNPDLPAIKLADGRLVSPLTDPDERLFISTLDDLVRGNIQSRNEGADYQVRIYGDDERLIAQRPEKWSDGHNTAYGMVGDAVFYDGTGSSWYAPQTLPESIRHKAYLEMDRRLIEYATAVYYPASPFQALEVTTNNPQVAQALRERMARLAIPGYVVLEP